jgi:hypothetical protein
MFAVLKQADIVVDQVLMNLSSGTAGEAMAAGRVLMTHTTGFIRDRYPHTLPTVDVNPNTLMTSLRELAADPTRRRELGRAGRVYARAYHDGAYSGTVLAEWIARTQGTK